MKRKKKLDIRKILVAIIAIVAMTFVIKLAIKNIIKQNKVKLQDNADIEQIADTHETTEQASNQGTEEVAEYRKKDSSSSSKQQTIKQERINAGKTLSSEGLPVLMYHFFYDKSKGETGQDGNWIEILNFEEQMKYLAENDFYFPTWQEVEDYIDGKIELPEKSVVITVDDGDPSFFDLAVPVIQKYDVFATSFVITYWYGNRAENKENNVSYQSHSYDMHKAGTNGKGVMLSWDYDKMKDDLALSSEVLGGANIFCYPFGQYNQLDIEVLKDTGYKLAFTTQAGRVKKGTSKYELPRVRVARETSLSAFIKKVD